MALNTFNYLSSLSLVSKRKREAEIRTERERKREREKDRQTDKHSGRQIER